MDRVNMRLACIILKHQKDELLLKSHMMTATSNDSMSISEEAWTRIHSWNCARKLSCYIWLFLRPVVKPVWNLPSMPICPAGIVIRLVMTQTNADKKVKSTDGSTKDSVAHTRDKSHLTFHEWLVRSLSFKKQSCGWNKVPMLPLHPHNHSICWRIFCWWKCLESNKVCIVEEI